MKEPHVSSPRRRLAVLGLVAITAACATVVTTQQLPTASDDAPTVEAPPEPAPPPFVAPPEPGWERFGFGNATPKQPEFPLLPGEPAGVSRAVGDVTDGYLFDAAVLPLPHAHMAVLPRQFDRRLIFTTDAMVDLISSAANHVAQAFEGSTLFLGNFSDAGGGDIPYSVSHNSGLDADLAFYMLDQEGRPAEPPGLVAVAPDGTYVHEDGQLWRFDVARNWKLVEGLVEAGRGRVQYIFISEELREMLLDHAREIGADREVVEHASLLLHQPRGALPHDDHFHVRIYCSERDVRAGCVNKGRRVPGYDGHHRARREAIAAALEAAADQEPAVRVAGIRRLGLLPSSQATRAAVAALEDQDARVRAAAARALGGFGDGRAALQRRLEEEGDPQVRVELVRSLADVGGRGAVRALTERLVEPDVARLPGDFDVDLRTVVADSLVELEDPHPVPALIDLLQSERDETRQRAARALRMLTNHDPTRGDAIAAVDVETLPGAQAAPDPHSAWKRWYEVNGDHSRDRWLATGFQDAGFEVEQISRRYVWEICRAVTDRDYLSYNAQRVLMRLSGKNPPSLTWPKDDASFYWRRWFEKRCRNCPPIPEELSTLK